MTLSIPALISKPARLWTWEEECAARDHLATQKEPLPAEGVRLLVALCDAEEARLERQGNFDRDD